MLHPFRRKILARLVEDGEMTRSELASRLVRDEGVSATDVEHVEIVLHHNHLPKLEDGDYIEYDRRTGDIALWKDPATLRACLDAGYRSSSDEHDA